MVNRVDEMSISFTQSLKIANFAKLNLLRAYMRLYIEHSVQEHENV